MAAELDPRAALISAMMQQQPDMGSGAPTPDQLAAMAAAQYQRAPGVPLAAASGKPVMSNGGALPLAALGQQQLNSNFAQTPFNPAAQTTLQ